MNESFFNYHNLISKTEDKEPLTIENLRACEGYENISEQEANAIIESLKTFAEIVISTHLKNNIIIFLIILMAKINQLEAFLLPTH